MIIGGVGGVFQVGPGGFRVGYDETFFPIIVTVGTDTIDDAFKNRLPITYTAQARIQNLTVDDWVNLEDVTYFQISGSENGGTANLTLRKPEKWSIEGCENADLLRPSKRILQIFCQIKIRQSAYMVSVFSGQVKNYSETHGQSGGSINIVAKISSLALANREQQNIESKTAYRRIADELEASGLFAIGQVPIVMFNDYVLDEPGQTFSDLLNMIESIAPVSVKVSTRVTGGVVIQPTDVVVEETPSFTLIDGNQVTITRSIGTGNSYNKIIVVGLAEGSLTTQVVKDDLDISRRGMIQYPYTYGDPNLDLSENVAKAESWLAEILRGKLSAQLQLNPFIIVGAVLNFSSARLFITDGQTRVGKFTHQYSFGKATTTISDMAVLT